MQAGVLLVICVTVALTVLSHIGILGQRRKEQQQLHERTALLLCRRAAVLYHNVIMYKDRPYLAPTIL